MWMIAALYWMFFAAARASYDMCQFYAGGVCQDYRYEVCGFYVKRLCSGDDNRRCCLKTTHSNSGIDSKKDRKCFEAGGSCQHKTNYCPNFYLRGKCGGTAGRQCCVKGTWCKWSQWSNCNATGKKKRSRLCRGPGKCAGNSEETRSCIPITTCPEISMASNGTVKDHSPFDSREDATILRRELDKKKPDWKAVLRLSGRRSASQRRKIVRAYSLFSKKKSLWKSVLKFVASLPNGEDMENLLEALWNPRLFDVHCLKKAMERSGTDEETLLEILVTRSNAEIREIKTLYKTETGRELVTDIKGDTSGYLEDLLVSLLNTKRDEGDVVNKRKAKKDAVELYRAGIATTGTDEDTFINIFSSRSFAQLRQIFCEYKIIAGEDIIDSINREFSGNMNNALKIIAEIARYPHAYFARRLHETMNGPTTDELSLIKIVVSRSEIDMKEIKDEFMKTYRGTLASWIKGDTGGDFRDLLLRLIGE